MREASPAPRRTPYTLPTRPAPRAAPAAPYVAGTAPSNSRPSARDLTDSSKPPMYAPAMPPSIAPTDRPAAPSFIALEMRARRATSRNQDFVIHLAAGLATAPAIE